MKFLILFAAVAAVLAEVPIEEQVLHEVELAELCKEKGVFANPHDPEGRTFIRCELEPIELRCDEEFIFDAEKLMCVEKPQPPAPINFDAVNWQEVLSCPDVEDKYFRNPYDCSRFYRCYKQGEFSRLDANKCLPTMIFDEVLETCLPTEQFRSYYGHACENAPLPDLNKEREVPEEKHEETQPETHEETQPETHEETQPETHEETQPETHEETQPETHEETQPETHEETQPETHEETQPETHEETQPETHEETQPETHEETQPEAHEETQPETHEETQPETHEETQPETHEETQPETHEENQPETHEETQPEVEPEVVPEEKEQVKEPTLAEILKQIKDMFKN